MQSSQSRPFYNSGMERLRSQNSLFNSGESRAYRERENSRDRNYDSRQNQRERGFSPGRSAYRNSSQDRENNYRYNQNYRPSYDRNRSASREREISDSWDLGLLHLCTQIGSEIFMSLQLNLLETFIFGFILEKQKFRKTCRAPQKDSLSRNLSRKSARTS